MVIYQLVSLQTLSNNDVWFIIQICGTLQTSNFKIEYSNSVFVVFFVGSVTITSFVYHVSLGVEFPYIPETNGVPLVADMSSNILSKSIDVSKVGSTDEHLIAFIYNSNQLQKLFKRSESKNISARFLKWSLRDKKTITVISSLFVKVMWRFHVYVKGREGCWHVSK